MKKSNLLFSALVAGLFATSAIAAEKATPVEVPNVTKEQCKATKGNKWEKDKCWSTAAASTTTTESTTTTAPATTAPAAPTAPATK